MGKTCLRCKIEIIPPKNIGGIARKYDPRKYCEECIDELYKIDGVPTGWVEVKP